MKVIHYFIFFLCLVAHIVIAQTRHLREEEEYEVKTKKGNRATNRTRKVSLSTSTTHASLYSLSSMLTLLGRSTENVDPGTARDPDGLLAENIATGKGDENEQKVGDYHHTTITTTAGEGEIQESRKLMHHWGVFKAYDNVPDDRRPPQYSRVTKRHAIEEYLSPMQRMMKKKRESSKIDRDEAFDGTWTGFDKIKH